MTTRGRTILGFLRVPNVLTAPADVIAGGLFAGGGAVDVGGMAVVSLASACLYAGGVALNDVADARSDARRRPERPIPSGRISRGAALGWAVVLLTLGVVLAASGPPGALPVACAVVVAVVLYDVALKHTWLAPAMMGTCRALNLGLGMTTAARGIPPDAAIPLACMWGYVTSVTVFARTEATTSARRPLVLASVGALASVMGVLLLSFVRRVNAVPVGIMLMSLIAVTMGPVRSAVRRRSPCSVQRAVKPMVLGVIVLDAAIAYAGAGLIPAALVLSLLVPAVMLGRVFRMT